MSGEIWASYMAALMQPAHEDEATARKREIRAVYLRAEQARKAKRTAQRTRLLEWVKEHPKDPKAAKARHREKKRTRARHALVNVPVE
jgi:hypothetical protein